jgi:hypothetical protein
MTIFRFPIRIGHRKAIGIQTTQSLAGPEAVKPRLERRVRIAALVTNWTAPINTNARIANATPSTEVFIIAFGISSKTSIHSRTRRMARRDNLIGVVPRGVDERQRAFTQRRSRAARDQIKYQ